MVCVSYLDTPMIPNTRRPAQKSRNFTTIQGNGMTSNQEA